MTNIPAPEHVGIEIMEEVRDRANSLLGGRSGVKLLEAGCGSASHLRLNGVSFTVGIDISFEQLKKNTMLDEKMLGDLQECPLPREGFDVAVCWMVLEHIPRPRDAMLNMFASLKPGGLLIIGVPNLLSFKGIATKCSPHWVHTAFYDFMRYKSRPFATYLRASLIPARLTRFAEQHGFTVEYRRLIQGDGTRKLRHRLPVLNAALMLTDAFIRLTSLGRAGSFCLDNFVVILRKHGQAP
jgi:2-polyprenyl-3-methyl-5-hydroxy-6-metoxy-1,4-benzoquinol methylase